MAKFEQPSINTTTKTTEQNLQSLKGYLSQLADELNVEMSGIENRLAALEKAVKEGDK